MKKYQVLFEPMGLTGEFPENTSILDCAHKLGINLVTVCSGRGTCGKCLIKLIKGPVSEVNETEKTHINPEELAQGFRLACKTNLIANCQIEIPAISLSTLQRAQIEGQEITIVSEPKVKTYQLHLTPPSFSAHQADLERLQTALSRHYQTEITTDFEILKQISSTLRENHWSIQAVINNSELIGLLSPAVRPLGLAVDLGTTKIALYLVDLISGQTLQSQGLINPQTTYGADIVSRMTTAIHSQEDAQKLREVVIDALNTSMTEMCRSLQVEPDSIVDFVVVGNTAMHHLFLGLPVKQLCKAPFTPAVDSSLDVKARELGLNSATGAYVHLLPNIAGYVGADHVAMILSTGLHRKQDITLALDIGTNTEICLSHRGSLSSLSCASGPAFEGAHIKHGMRVTQGAIEHFLIADNRIEYQTIGNGTAVGICGSGIIDIVAQLYLHGVIDRHGRMHRQAYVREKEGVLEFVIASGNGDRPDITFTQKDVREIQLAKGAIRAGIEVLLKTYNLTVKDVDEVIIAGAFGTYIDVSSAISIGMLPALPWSVFVRSVMPPAWALKWHLFLLDSAVLLRR
jgi:uncharacterized 2Fe-2S/4Fe-4S cluster protein (DUF4445 family)